MEGFRREGCSPEQSARDDSKIHPEKSLRERKKNKRILIFYFFFLKESARRRRRENFLMGIVPFYWRLSLKASLVTQKEFSFLAKWNICENLSSIALSSTLSDPETKTRIPLAGEGWQSIVETVCLTVWKGSDYFFFVWCFFSSLGRKRKKE